MTYRSAEEILREADSGGMRRAFIATALLLEMEAVRSHLRPVGSVLGRDGAVYECGVFSDSATDWVVVVTETGAGTHAAESAVTHANILFPGFEVMFFVGIGGSRKSDVPLGSVVASDHVYMPYSAKFSDGMRLSRPRTLQVDGRLLGIAKKVRRDKSWPTRIRDPKDGKLPPIDAYATEPPPLGLVAPIASIEAVLADPESELEALLAEGFDDTCVVEMEGYGAVYAASREHIPSIVVRGVSDMTRDKSPEKDAEHQPTAACHAAAFAFEMLSHWGQAYSTDTVVALGATPTPLVIESGRGVRGAGPVDHEREGETDSIIEPEPVKPGNVETVPASKPSPDLVLNIDEKFPADLEARVSAIEAMLREIVSSDEVTVTDAKPGSLRLFIADPLSELRNMGVTELRAAFAKRHQPELLGMVDVTEYASLDSVRAQLGAASAELMAWPNSLPDGEMIDRPELGQLIDKLDSYMASTTAVLGPPGAGKSALLATLANRYVEIGWPVLAIKGDLLYAGISSEEELQEHLGLDAPPSNLLQRLARFQRVLLILDQLDALAGYLDLRTARLSILLSLVRRLGGIDNVHIVLSSRTFEFDHDVRLRAVSTEALTLELPAWSQVLALLEARGVRAAGWPEDAQEVMRSPQALATYLKLKGKQQSEAFTSYQGMLDELWRDRVLAGNGGDRRSELASKIADQMASEESLWLARARYDENGEEIDALEAAGVLTTSKGSLGFKHQTLFEYALARSFARQTGRLTGYVLQRQTSLFFRSKLWAGLSYLRNADINAYHSELRGIWNAPDLRKHLRFLLIDFLGQEKSPTDREALLLAEALQLPEQRWAAYRALAGSPGWFERFRYSFIADCMDESDEAASAMVDVLARAWPFAEDAVLDLVKERWVPDRNHDTRSWMVIYSAPRWSDPTLEVARIIVGRSEIAQHFIDYVVETIGVEQPETVLHLVRARLDRDLAAAETRAEELSHERMPDPESIAALVDWQLTKDPRVPLNKLIDQGQGWEPLPSLAEHAPAEFLETLWPWFERCFNALKARTEERLGRLGFAPGPDFRFEEENDGLSEPVLMASLRTAAERLARTDPDAWLAWVAKVEGLDMEPAQRLIAHCFTVLHEQFARQALVFLLEDPRRYTLGSIGDPTSTSSRLVRKASDHWTDEEIAKFEMAVRSFRPSAPPDLTGAGERRRWNREIRWVKVSLLRALPKNRLTARMRRHVEEEERVFPESERGSRSTGARVIGSIMDSDMIARASDEDVINAFRTLPDATGWDHPRDWMVGGNIQLSREFATFAKENPTRAIRLIGLLEPENGTRATGYALEAMSESAAPEQVLRLLGEVVRRGFDSKEFRELASRAVVKLINQKVAIGDDTISILEGWLTDQQIADESTKKANLVTDVGTGLEAVHAESEDQDDRIQRSFLWGQGGISLVPGGDYPILEALIRIRLEREEFGRIDEMLRAYLDRCKDVEVWGSLLRYTPHLYPHNTTLRSALLERLLTELPALVETRDAAHVFANAHWWDADFANAQLDRWRVSRSRAARQAYGEMLAIVALMQPTLGWAQTRLDTLIGDETTEDARTGAALTAANLWPQANRRAAAGDLLRRLLNEAGTDVWRATFELFRLTDELTPDPPTVSLLTVIADRIGSAPRLDATFVVERLGTLLPHQAELVGRLTDGLIGTWQTELGDVRTGTAAAAPQLVDLAITLHRLGPETHEIGTALFERLIEIDAWEARKTMDEIDNRFLDEAPPRRRRLARRSRARRRGSRRPGDSTAN